MQVSVILPVYNEEDWMRICLDSLMEQTIPFELIVVDNGSTDASVQVAQEYTRLVFLAEKSKLNAINMGVQKTSGDVVVTVDADCYYPPTFLERLTKHFLDPSIVMVSGSFHNVNMPYITQIIFRIRISFLHFFLFYSPGSATAYRTETFLMVGGYKPVKRPFLRVAWEEQFRFNASITRFGRRVWEPKAHCIHYRPRELCVVCKRDPDSVICVFCKEIETEQRF